MVFVVKKSLVICRFYINSRLCLLNNIRCRHDVLGSGDESLLAQVKIFLEEGPSYFKGLTSEEKET